MANRSGSSSAAKKKIEKKICSACQKEKRTAEFYISYNPLHKDGRIPMCKDCIKDACYSDNGEFDIENFKSLLRQLDKPFIQSVWDSSEKEVLQNTNYNDILSLDAVVGKYMKNISMSQFRTLNWEDGLNYADKSLSGGQVEASTRKPITHNRYYLSNEEFVVTEEIIRLFGEGYTSKEYETMQRIYDDMKQEYPNISNNQKNLLLRYVRFAAKEEIATSLGEIANAEKWSKMSTEALKQLNSIDTQGGVTCFSEFFQQFEREKDVSRILPKFKYRPNDAPDFIILCYINYCRRLEGKPEVSYEDVYKFYDEKVAEYLKQYGDPYGIFQDSTTLVNRERIKEFIELPPDYYEDGD